MKRVLIGLGFLTLGMMSAIADVILDSELIATEGEPVLGRFYGYRTSIEGPSDAFNKIKAKAIQENLPLIVIWSSADECKYCNAFSTSLNDNKARVLEWMAGKRALFGFFKGSTQYGQSVASQQAYDFCIAMGISVGYEAWPWHAFYYVRDDGNVFSARGSLTKRDNVTTQVRAMTADEFMKTVDLYLSLYQKAEEIPVAGSTDFQVGGRTPEASLQAMPSTKTVYVPLIRTSKLDVAETNVVKVVYPDGDEFSTNLIWSADAAAVSQSQEVPVPIVGHYAKGARVTLTLRNALGVLNATNGIEFVEEADNSQRFPYWLGEKTESELQWGEWTMDLDVATNKVRQASGKAYTVVAVGGALWCPNCTNIERSVYNDPKFTKWAQDHQVALVMFDQPNNGMTGPTLLTHDVGTSGGGFGKSGTSYLSRKGLTIAEGKAQYDRVYVLSHTRWPGGWLVEPTAGRISNPVLIVLRPDGSPAGRLAAQRTKTGGATSNEPYDIDENLARLTELLALADDRSAHGLTEETNNKAGTTSLRMGADETVVGALQVNDREDVYRLDASSFGTENAYRFDIVAPDATQTVVSLSALLPTNGEGSAMLCRELPILASNTWRFTQAQLTRGVYLRVAAYSATDVTGSIAEYRYPKYRGASAFGFSVKAQAVPPDPGVVGFAQPELLAEEGERLVLLPVERTRGASGAVSVRVDLNPGKTTADADGYVWKSDDPTHIVTWGDAEFGVKYVPLQLVDDGIWRGDDERIAFSLLKIGESAAEVALAEMVALIHDDDAPDPGQLAITATSPNATQGLIVDAAAGSEVELTVTRLGGGAVGSIATGFTASNGAVTFSTNRLYWADKNANLPNRGASQKVRVRVPSLEALGDSPAFTVSLAVEEPGEAVLAKRRVIVRVTDTADARFDRDVVSESRSQHTLFHEIMTLIDDLTGASNVRVKTVSGKLPAGVDVSWNAESNALVADGVASVAGDWSSTVRLEYEVDGESRVSRPVSLGLAVRSLQNELSYELRSVTFNTLPVLDGNRRLVGMLDIALPVSGRVSAKYRRYDGTTAVFSARCWDSVVPAGVSVQLLGEGCSLLVSSVADGTYDISIDDPDRGPLTVEAQKYPSWTAADAADGWDETYTVECLMATNRTYSPQPLCCGAATLSCRMTATSAGRMIWAGCLPNGKTFSGSSRLVRIDETGVEASLPVFSGTKSDTFGASMVIFSREIIALDGKLVFGDVSVASGWTHRESGAGPAYSYAVDFDIHGSLYRPASDWSSYWLNAYGLQALPFGAVGTDLKTQVAIGSGNELVIADPNANPLKLTIETDAESGIVKGSCSPDGGQTIWNFRGVILPGWVDCGGCGEEFHLEMPERPFVTGTWWKSEQFEPTLRVTVGNGISIGR